MKICKLDFEEETTFQKNPFTLVIFGGSGDLSQRKLMPAIYHLYSLEQFHCEFNIVAYGMPEMTDEEYRDLVRKSLETYYKNSEKGDLENFISRFHYVSGGFEDSKSFLNILEKHKSFGIEDSQLLYYLAIPPAFAKSVIANLGQKEFAESGIQKKIIMEKPFGVDKESAVELNAFVSTVFEENEIYRIDHYLGKETVQNILFFRFGNSIFEPLWNRNYIDHIQITAAESIGIEHRGKFYESAGVVRDIVQNHALQLLALVTMEPPSSFDADMIRDEKLKVFNSMRDMDLDYIKENTVKGQYNGGDGGNSYKDEPDVSKDSTMATYMAGKFFVDNWRWADVPIYLRAGKKLKERVTEIYLQFKQAPLKLFGDRCNEIVPNGILISIQPEEKISIRLNLKYPGSENLPHPVEMNFDYKELGDYINLEAYERLILDALKGDLTLFARQDEVEVMWDIVDPINKHFEDKDNKELPTYQSGTWGPSKGDDLIHRDGKCWRLSDTCVVMEEV